MNRARLSVEELPSRALLATGTLSSAIPAPDLAPAQERVHRVVETALFPASGEAIDGSGITGMGPITQEWELVDQTISYRGDGSGPLPDYLTIDQEAGVYGVHDTIRALGGDGFNDITRVGNGLFLIDHDVQAFSIAILNGKGDRASVILPAENGASVTVSTDSSVSLSSEEEEGGGNVGGGDAPSDADGGGGGGGGDFTPLVFDSELPETDTLSGGGEYDLSSDPVDNLEDELLDGLKSDPPLPVSSAAPDAMEEEMIIALALHTRTAPSQDIPDIQTLQSLPEIPVHVEPPSIEELATTSPQSGIIRITDPETFANDSQTPVAIIASDPAEKQETEEPRVTGLPTYLTEIVGNRALLLSAAYAAKALWNRLSRRWRPKAHDPSIADEDA